MIKWSQLPISDLTIAALISLETAGFVGNKYSSLHGFVYMFSIIFIIIFMISLDAVNSKNNLEKIEPKNNVVPVKTKLEYENRIESKQWFWQSA